MPHLDVDELSKKGKFLYDRVVLENDNAFFCFIYAFNRYIADSAALPSPLYHYQRVI